jgi:hypothetical protein
MLMLDQPKQFGYEYASIFQDASVIYGKSLAPFADR